jgi:NADPH:quinone reductase-like Zn-dependent oxidoreductase
MTSHHTAAVFVAKGEPFVLQQLPTQDPRDNEILIEVKAFSVAPAQVIQRDQAFPAITVLPTVIRTDIAGIVTSRGSTVPKDAPQPGGR